MESGIYIKIGKRVKQIRLESKITLQEVSEKAGVSKSLVSKIENGRTIPSLPVLLQIINALKTDTASFFQDINNDLSYGYILNKAAENEPIQREESEGFNYFSAISASLPKVEFQSAILKLNTGAKREKVTTDGFTFIYLLEGEIFYYLEQEEILMKTGDSLFFDGRIPHVPENIGENTAILMVIYLLNI